MYKLNVMKTALVLTEEDGTIIVDRPTSEAIKELLELIEKVKDTEKCMKGFQYVNPEHFSFAEFKVRVAEKLEYYIERDYKTELTGYTGEEKFFTMVLDTIAKIMMVGGEYEKASM